MVYILEDDNAILELIMYALKSQNIESKGFSRVEELYAALKERVADILVLDVMLPCENGFEVLSKLKDSNATKDMTIIMLTALNSEYDKVRGLDLGADDYITKPFGVMEFLARIRAILRRKNVDKSIDISLDGLSYSSTKHTIELDSKPLKLTFKEFELLGFLLKNEERVFSREELSQILWGHSLLKDSRTIDIHIKSLRKKLGAWGRHIKTIHSVGYKLSKVC